MYVSRRKETGMVRVKFLSALRSHQLPNPGEAFCWQLQGLLRLPVFERAGNSYSRSLHLLYFFGIKNCPVHLKPFIGSYCNFGAFDQEQQSSESRRFFL